MTKDNIIKFPQPEDNLAPEHRMADVARLAEHVAELMDADDSPMSIGDLLDRIESASSGLSEIGTLMLHGADRLKMEQLCSNVQDMIARIRITLEEAGVECGRREDD